MRPLLESRRLGGGSGLWPCRPGARGSAPRRRGGAGRGERVCTGRGGPPGARCGAARAGRGSALTPGLGVPALPQVEVIKKAYMQGEVEVEDSESDEEDGGNGEDGAASPRNVGHNIYILAHQVPARRARPTHTPALRLHPGLASVPDGGPGCHPQDAPVSRSLCWGHVPGNPPPPRASPWAAVHRVGVCLEPTGGAPGAPWVSTSEAEPRKRPTSLPGLPCGLCGNRLVPATAFGGGGGC